MEQTSSKPTVILFINKTYYEDKTLNDYDNSVLNTWLKANNKRRSELNIIIEAITKGYIMRNGYYARNFWQKYKEIITKYKNTYILFDSISDIHPSPETALRFISEIAGHSNKIKIYILSLNIYNDVCSHYLLPNGIKISLMDIYNIDKLKKTHLFQDDDRYKLDFFLCDKGLSFSEVSKITGKPKSTINKKYNMKHPKNNPTDIRDPGISGLPKEQINELIEEFLNMNK